jgi:hypothetical protein
VPQFENFQGIVIPKRGILARGICCFAADNNRFLADKTGFGMTGGGIYLRKMHDYRLFEQPPACNV